MVISQNGGYASVQEIKIVAEELYFRRDKMAFDNYNCTIEESVLILVLNRPTKWVHFKIGRFSFLSH